LRENERGGCTRHPIFAISITLFFPTSTTFLAEKLQELLTEIDLAPTPEAGIDAKLKVAWEYLLRSNTRKSYQWCEVIEKEALAIQYEKELAGACFY
jgi:hypothetical protein